MKGRQNGASLISTEHEDDIIRRQARKDLMQAALGPINRYLVMAPFLPLSPAPLATRLADCAAARANELPALFDQLSSADRTHGTGGIGGVLCALARGAAGSAAYCRF